MNRRLLAASLGAAVVVSIGRRVGASAATTATSPPTTRSPTTRTSAARRSPPSTPTLPCQGDAAARRRRCVDNDGNDVALRSLDRHADGHQLLVLHVRAVQEGAPRLRRRARRARRPDPLRRRQPRRTTPEVNESFAADRGVQLRAAPRSRRRLHQRGRHRAAPVTLFVTADGTIVRQTGVLDEDELRRVRERAAGMNLSLRASSSAWSPRSTRVASSCCPPTCCTSSACPAPTAGAQRAPIGRALLVSGAVSAGFMLVFLVVGAGHQVLHQLARREREVRHRGHRRGADRARHRDAVRLPAADQHAEARRRRPRPHRRGRCSCTASPTRWPRSAARIAAVQRHPVRHREPRGLRSPASPTSSPTARAWRWW